MYIFIHTYLYIHIYIYIQIYIRIIIMQETLQLPKQVLNQIKKEQPKYKKISQIAYYCQLDHLGKMGIFTKSLADVQCNVVFCLDSVKAADVKKQDLLYYIIRILDQQIPKLKKKYSLVYIHNSYTNYKRFRNLLQLLPAEYLLKLKIIYEVNVGTTAKIYSKFFFGAINSYLQSKIQYVNSLEEIQSKNKIILGGNVTKSQLKLKMQEDDGLGQTKTPMIQMNVEHPQIIHNQIYGKQISQYELWDGYVPKLIYYMVGKIYSNSESLKSQGIMRKSCNVQQLEILENFIIAEDNPYKMICGFEDSTTLGGCVKKIFNNLNTPLLGYDLYDIIMAYRSTGVLENDLNFLKESIESLKQINRNVLIFTLTFFLKGIVQYKQFNKMSIYNLAVVFGPCFFRPKNYKLEDLFNSGKFSWFIKTLLQNFNEVISEEQFNRAVQALETIAHDIHSSIQ